jgi:fused signal recognition particle receptor
VCQKQIPEAPHETLLVLDATVGQNALDQARTFHKSTPITGIVLTKLDGSAKGGIAIAIQKELHIPIRWIGIGEGKTDLAPFHAESYVNALLDV